jgi:hypothetical protein
MTNKIRGLEELARRESQREPLERGDIPEHFALSLSELRDMQRRPSPSVVTPSAPSAPSPSPLDNVAETAISAPGPQIRTFNELIDAISGTLETIASTSDSVDHAKLDALARRLRELRVIKKRGPQLPPALEYTQREREQGTPWSTIIESLNARIEAGETEFATPQGKAWNRSSLNSALRRATK